MNFPRRRFLGSSLVVLGSSLLEALGTPLWKWKRSAVLRAASIPRPTAPSPVQFIDVAREAGLNVPNVWGGVDHKKYIIEAKGSGLAFFDYDNDGWLDILILTGSRFGDPPRDASNRLYKNNRDGTFTDVTQSAGLFRSGYFYGVTIGDYNNDGFEDIFLTGWEQNTPVTKAHDRSLTANSSVGSVRPT